MRYYSELYTYLPLLLKVFNTTPLTTDLEGSQIRAIQAIGLDKYISVAIHITADLLRYITYWEFMFPTVKLKAFWKNGEYLEQILGKKIEQNLNTDPIHLA